MLGALSRLPSWELDHDEDDIRGWALRDRQGHTLGMVDELIVDTGTETVAQVVLGDGKKFSAHDVFVGDHFLTLTGGSEPEQAASSPASRAPSAAKPTPSAPSAAKDVRADVPARAAPVAAAPVRPDPKRPVETDAPDLVLPLIDEEIDVSKRRFDAGGVRVDAHVVTKPFDQDVALREEHVRVVRRAVDKPLLAADAEARLRDATIEMSARSELPVVGKRVHVVEEIVIKKQVSEHVEHVRDTVRRTSAEVTRLPGADLAIKGAKES